VQAGTREAPTLLTDPECGYIISVSVPSTLASPPAPEAFEPPPRRSGQLVLDQLTRAVSWSLRSRALRLLGLAAAVGLLIVEGIYIAPYVGRALDRLAHLDAGWLAVAVSAEIVSLFAAAHVQRRMLLIGGTRVPVARMTALYYSANAVSLTLPAGPAIGSGYTFRRLRHWGASVPLATFTLVASGALSTLAFGILVAVAAVIQHDSAAEPAVVSLIAVGVLAATVFLRWVARRPEAVDRIGTKVLRLANRVLHHHPDHGRETLREILLELKRLRPRHRDWAFGLTYASLNWACDLLCLYACCEAVNAPRITLTLVAVAYVAGMSAAGISLLPGGLGVVDAAMLLTLTHGHVGLVAATAAVVLYRLISYGFNVTLGWMIWVARWHMHRADPAPRT
jgi:uncharacterized protein (TIRG00374 family)